MNILVINSGSSSIKFQLINMPREYVICSGMVERIGLPKPTLHYQTSDKNIHKPIAAATHEQGLQAITAQLIDPESGVINSPEEIEVVGHRVVHGGAHFSAPMIINEAVKTAVRDLATLAPLHNPPNLTGILVAEAFFPLAKQIAIFDTAFHQSLPAVAYQYALPKAISQEQQIRAYGFHGTSHKYVTEKAIAYLGLKKSKIISIHLGNGCSITAVKDGKSIDTSLGFGPMNGLIMGTRVGDIDQAVVLHLMEKMNLSFHDIRELLQKKSGLLGLTGKSDLREIEAAANNGNTDCQLALEMSAYRIKKYIGGYAAVMNGLDAIVFTAGIGENSVTLRRMVCSEMDYLGMEINEEKNAALGKGIQEIQKAGMKVKILVIPTNEEIEIARQCFELAKQPLEQESA